MQGRAWALNEVPVVSLAMELIYSLTRRWDLLLKTAYDTY